MAIYSFWIFDRHCNCVFSREWDPKTPASGSKLFNYSLTSSSSANITNNSSSSTNIANSPNPNSASINTLANDNISSNGLINADNMNDNAKLLFGAIFSLRNIAAKLYSKNDALDPAPNAILNYLQSFSTEHYRVHYYETATNWKFAIISDPKVEDLQYALRYIYAVLFNEHVVKNALSMVNFQEGEYISNHNFVGGVDQYVTSLPNFAS